MIKKKSLEGVFPCLLPRSSTLVRRDCFTAEPWGNWANYTVAFCYMRGLRPLTYWLTKADVQRNGWKGMVVLNDTMRRLANAGVKPDGNPVRLDPFTYLVPLATGDRGCPQEAVNAALLDTRVSAAAISAITEKKQVPGREMTQLLFTTPSPWHLLCSSDPCSLGRWNAQFAQANGMEASQWALQNKPLEAVAGLGVGTGFDEVLLPEAGFAPAPNDLTDGYPMAIA